MTGQQFTDIDRERAVRLAALHYSDLDADWQRWLIAQVTGAGIRDIGTGGAVEILSTLSTWATVTEDGQRVLQAELRR